MAVLLTVIGRSPNVLRYGVNQDGVVATTNTRTAADLRLDLDFLDSPLDKLLQKVQAGPSGQGLMAALIFGARITPPVNEIESHAITRILRKSSAVPTINQLSVAADVIGPNDVMRFSTTGLEVDSWNIEIRLDYTNDQ